MSNGSLKAVEDLEQFTILQLGALEVLTQVFKLTDRLLRNEANA